MKFRIGDKVKINDELSLHDSFGKYGIIRYKIYTILNFINHDNIEYLKLKGLDDDVSFSSKVFYKHIENIKLYKKVLNV